MDYRSVESSNIEALAHTGDTLGVKFKGGTEYHYHGVSSDLFQEIIDAASIGHTFNQLIRSHPSDYPYERVH